MATQRTIAKELFPWIARLVGDSGVCATSATGRQQILEDLDLALSALVDRMDSEGLLFDFYVPVKEGCIALPQECREARYIVLNGVPLRQRDEWYEGRVGSGACAGGCGIGECLDLGDFYIPQPLPKRRGIRIALVALSDADAGKEVVIQVTDEYGNPQRETLTLLSGQRPVLTNAVAYDVTFFLKPKTVGNVSLQLSYDDGQRFYLPHCHYLPQTEEGLFRRKAIPQRFWGCNLAKIKGKLRYDRLTDENQIVPFNNRLALGFAVQAVARWGAKDVEGFNTMLAMAINELNKQMQDADSAKNVRQVTFLTQGAARTQANNHKCWL